MRVWLCGYCLGIAVVAMLPALNASMGVGLLAIYSCSLLANCLLRRRLVWVLLFAAGIGMLWHWTWATRQLDAGLAAHLEGQDITVSGRVVGIPEATANGQRFVFVVASDADILANRRLRLNTFGQGLQLQSGETWRLVVRLKRPHNYANPGSFDTEASLFRQAIVASGYVRESSVNIRLRESGLNVSSLRSGMLRKIQRLLHERLPASRNHSLLLALILGDRSQLSTAQWELFSATGTNHLFVISGLHIGLVAMLAFRCALGLLKLPPGMMLTLPAQSLAAVFAMAVAVVYSLMAGWTLPTQRACIMLLVFLSVYLSRRRISVSLRFLLAMAMVLALDPLAIVSAGFWLSFSAVAVLLFSVSPVRFGSGQLDVESRWHGLWRKFVRPQLAVFVGLMLPLLMTMGQVSLLAPLVNLFAIPLLGLGIVPLLLLASIVLSFSESLSALLFAFADSCLSILLLSLEWASSRFPALAQLPLPVPEPWMLLFLLPGVLLLLLPAGMPFRHLCLPLTLPLLLAQTSRGPEAVLQVQVFDVGQGLAVLLRTANHTLLYDTGPGTTNEWDAGRAVVLPALRVSGVNSLNMIIVSHGDTDHAGGLASVLERFPQAAVIGGEAIAGVTMELCHKGMNWQWDGVRFEILSPAIAGSTTASRNDRSCVLRVQAGENSILLPGDIESAAEHELARQFGSGLDSTVMVAPHHGSKTSSSYPLLKMVAAEHVIFSSAYRSPFGHPADSIVVRHSQMGSRLYSTSSTGMLTFSMGVNAAELDVGQYRPEHRRYWSWSHNSRLCRYC